MDLRCTLMFPRQIRWLGQLGSHDSRHTMFSRTVSSLLDQQDTFLHEIDYRNYRQ